MTAFNLREGLDRAGQLRDPEYALRDVISDLEASGCTGPSVIATLFDFMEKNPYMDMGASSPLCRFLEETQGYEKELIRSIARRPTIYSIGMLYGLINGAPAESERTELIAVLRAVLNHPDTDDYLKENIRAYLERPSIQRRRPRGPDPG